jgi:hypothetical protein
MQHQQPEALHDPVRDTEKLSNMFLMTQKITLLEIKNK